jgi:hypothetical protein
MSVSLKEFVSQALRDILDGVTDAQTDKKIGKNIAPWGIGDIAYPSDSGAIRKGPFTATVVKFDVAVTAEVTGSAAAGGALKIAVFNLGAHGERGNKNVATNRIQFSVPVSLPSGDGDPAAYGKTQNLAQ